MVSSKFSPLHHGLKNVLIWSHQIKERFLIWILLVNSTWAITFFSKIFHVRIFECLGSGCPVNRFSHLSCSFMQFLQHYPQLFLLTKFIFTLSLTFGQWPPLGSNGCSMLYKLNPKLNPNSNGFNGALQDVQSLND